MKKLIKRSLIVALLFVCVLQCTTVFANENVDRNISLVSAENQESRMRGEITGNGVRIRKTASTSSAVLGLLYKGDSVNIINLVTNSQGEWALVRTQSGILGYVSTDYIAV